MIPQRPHQMNRGPMLKRDPLWVVNFLKKGGIKRHILIMLSMVKYYLIAAVKAYWSRKNLCHEIGASRAGRIGNVIAVSPYYGSDSLLASFLDYHRSLGVDYFIFLDLSEDSTLSTKLAGQVDCAVWRPCGAWKPAQVLHWMNFLRWRYACGRWCLSIQPNERFVFFRSETRSIKDLIDFLENESRDHIYSLVLEMYGEVPAGTLEFRNGDDPLSLLQYFDPLGYATTEAGTNRNVVVRGGVQRRVLFNRTPRRSPALNRIPLVKWRWPFAYVAGTRLVLPRRVNTPHGPWHSSPTACVLCFAQLETPSALAVAAEAEMETIVSDGSPGLFDGVKKLQEMALKQPFSQRYTTSSGLVENGLLNPGQWF